MNKVLAYALLLLPLMATPVCAGGLSKAEINRLKAEIATAVSQGYWYNVEDPMRQLAKANSLGVWRYLVKLTEQSPWDSELHLVLGGCANQMTRRAVRREIKKTASRSNSLFVRREMVLHLAGRKEWDALLEIEAMKDADEEVAAAACWLLADARVESAVDPMIDELVRLAPEKKGIWDVLHNCLELMLGPNLKTEEEYRSRWREVKAQGGLTSKKAQVETKVEPDPRDTRVRTTTVSLFGRKLYTTRIVFLLEVSQDMAAVDGDHPGSNRLERAKQELKRVIQKLPAHFKINVITYSSFVRFWRPGRAHRVHEPLPPPWPANEPKYTRVHSLDARARKSACEWISKLEPERPGSISSTATDGALSAAFRIVGARSIFVFSAGHETRPLEATLQILRKYSWRHVAIHTLGFPGANRDALRAVAKLSRGRYSDIK